MTYLHDHDPWPGLPRLSDPIAGRALPGPDNPRARDLVGTIMAGSAGTANRGPRTSKHRYALLAAVAVAAIAVLGSVLIVDTGNADAAPLLAAIDRTAALDRGQLEIEDSRTVDGITVTDRATVRYRGQDKEITGRPDPSKALAEIELGSRGFVPDLLELRTVDGKHYMRVAAEESDGLWRTATYEGSRPYETFGARVRRIVENGRDLEQCDGEPNRTAYCLTTTSSVDVQEFVTHLALSGTADIRVEIDDETGLLSSFHITATTAKIEDPDSPFDLPTYDMIETRWRYQPLSDDWQSEVPKLSDDVPLPLTAEEETCLALDDPDEVDACLADLGQWVEDSSGS